MKLLDSADVAPAVVCRERESLEVALGYAASDRYVLFSTAYAKLFAPPARRQKKATAKKPRKSTAGKAKKTGKKTTAKASAKKSAKAKA